MGKKVTQEINFFEDGDITASTGYRNKLFKPWFQDDKWGVEIIDGFYKDTVVQFKEMEFIESNDGNVSLDYHLIHRPYLVSDDDIKSSEFSNLLTLIIEDILREALEANETRNNDIEKSGS
jgi:hypothetical protein